MVPLVVREKTDAGIEHFDIYSRLLQDRIVYIDQPIDARSASLTVSQLLFLSNQGEDDITIYIDSPGGSVVSGLSIYDCIQHIPCDVKTIGLGLCASMGAFLLSCGTKGKRSVLPSSRIMIHMVSSGTEGTVVDQRIALENALDLNDYLAQRLSIHCGRPQEEVERAIERDYWMTAGEAKNFGLIDEVLKFAKNSWPTPAFATKKPRVRGK